MPSLEIGARQWNYSKRLNYTGGKHQFAILYMEAAPVFVKRPHLGTVEPGVWTPGIRVKLPNAGADTSIVTVPLIYQPARQRCCLQVLVLVIYFQPDNCSEPRWTVHSPSIESANSSRQSSREEGQTKPERQASNSHGSTK
jgi:hypothetical protein